MASRAAKRKAKAQRRAGKEPPLRLVIRERLQIGEETTTVAYAADSIMLMLQNGSICKRLAAAGSRFRVAFNESCISNIRAVDWTEPPGMGSGALLWPAGGAAWVSWTREVQPALDALGGTGNPMRDIAWHVLGCGRSLSDFASNVGWGDKKPRNRQQATGILTAALNKLAEHYEN